MTDDLQQQQQKQQHQDQDQNPGESRHAVTLCPGRVGLLPDCRYTLAGLESLALARGLSVQLLTRSATEQAGPPAPVSRAICHLSGDLAGRLAQVARLGDYLQSRGDTLPVTLLTREPMPWLYGTLLHLTGRTQSLQAVWTLDARSPLTDMVNLLWGATPAAAHPLRGRESYTLASGLTRRELSVVRAVLAGERIRDMAQRTGLSVSVLYAQRHHGLRKLGAGTGIR